MEPNADPTRRTSSWLLPVLFATAVVVVTLVALLVSRPLTESIASVLARPVADSTRADSSAIAGETVRLARRLEARRPRGAFLVVSSTDNRFRLMKGADTLRAGLCSTGSYVHLTAGDGRNWLFATPRGTFRIQEKRVNPVWSKPDWAFIEEGLPVPPQGSAERFERGVLGNYALSIGNGYLIHGTPYQRLLGMPVSHGCVRLGDKDLEEIYRTLAVGSPVFLY